MYIFECYWIGKEPVIRISSSHILSSFSSSPLLFIISFLCCSMYTYKSDLSQKPYGNSKSSLYYTTPPSSSVSMSDFEN